MIRGTKRLLLAGASAVAILVGAAQAEATSYSIPGMYTFITPASGEYAIEAVGAVGGSSQEPPEYGGTSLIPGGPGAEAAGDVFLSAGEHLIIYVGGAGYTATFGNAGDGGGGGSFVFGPSSLLAAAGGGGGAGSGFGYVVGNISPGGPGQAGQSGQAGYGGFGGAGGVGGNGGGGGTLILCDGCVGNGGGGTGVNSAGGNGAGTASGGGGTLPVGGIGWEGGSYAGGGYGGGGGAGAGGGGGGGGNSGGGGGTSYPFYGGGGGGSYLAPAFTNQVLLGGVNYYDGYVSIDLLSPSVPEPSTWGMMLLGFVGLGFLGHRKANKGRAAPAAT